MWNKEVLALVFEFVISILGIFVGAALVYSGRDGNGIGIVMITSIITFWFSRRIADANTKANQQAASTAIVTPELVQAVAQALSEPQAEPTAQAGKKP